MGNAEVNYSEIINETASKHYNVRDEFKSNTVEENREICRDDSLGFGVAAISLTGDLNIGIMIRTASLMGADEFYIFGRRKYDKRSTVGAHNYIDVHRPGDIDVDNIIKICLDGGYTPIFIEQGGEDIKDVNKLRGWVNRPLFIFGSESEGIPEDLMNRIRFRSEVPTYTMSLPQRGVLRSYNVSTAMSIVTWEWTRLLMDN